MSDKLLTKTELLEQLTKNIATLTGQDVRNIINSTMVSGPGVWDDLRGEIAAIDASLTTAELGVTLPVFRNNQDDTISLRFQLPHSYDPGTNLKLHAHTAPLADTSGSAYYRVRYAIMNEGEAIPLTVNDFTESFVSVTYDAAGRYLATTRTLVEIPGTSLRESTIIFVDVSRAATDPLDTYDGSIGALFADIHYRVRKPGTLDEYPA